jgi:transcriptional regulator with XRE-family HTH domain
MLRRKMANKIGADLSAQAETRADPKAIAARIKSIRRKKAITLERLARDTGLDRGYLSRIERGHKTPSIAALLKIAAAMGVQMAHLFGEAVGPNSIRIVRRSAYRAFPGPTASNEHSLMLVLAQSAAHRLSAYLISPGQQPTAGSADHPGDELIFVLAGQVEIGFADRKVCLGEGDTVHFDGHLRHDIRRVGRRSAQALIVVAQDPPGSATAKN